MPTVEVRVPGDDRVYELYVPEDTNIEAAVRRFPRLRGGPVVSAPAPSPAPEPPPEDPSAHPLRGLGIALRGVSQAVRPVFWVSDALTAPVARGLGLGEPDSVGAYDAMLDTWLPKPSSTAERATVGGLEALALGAAGGVGLAARAAKAAAAASGPLLNVGRSFAARPGRFLAAEAGGGAGASAAADVTADAPNPLAQAGAALAGGVAGAAAPGAALRMAARPKQAWQKAKTVGTDALAGGSAGLAAGPEIGAAAALGTHLAQRAVQRARRRVTLPGGRSVPLGLTRTLQKIQEVPRRPEEIAQAMQKAPAGVTGARALSDRNLMAIEKGLSESDPALAARIEKSRRGAERQTLEELTQLGPKTQGASALTRWQRRVLRAVAPDDTAVKASRPREMAAEVYGRFRREYEAIGPVWVAADAAQLKAFRKSLRDAVNDRRIIAAKGTRQDVRRWAMAHLKDFAADDGGNLLALRSYVRDHRRRVAAGGSRKAQERSALIGRVEDFLTEKIEAALPRVAAARLRQLDGAYAQFKTVENAIARGTVGELKASDLAAAVRSATPGTGRIAQGRAGPLDALSDVGYDVTEALGKKGRSDQRLARALAAAPQAEKVAMRKRLVHALLERTRTSDTISGTRLAKAVRDERDTLKAAGIAVADRTRLGRLAEQLTLVQRKATGGTSPDPETLSFFGDVLARATGAKLARTISRTIGAHGVGELTMTSAMAKQMRQLLTKAKGDTGVKLLAEAMEPTPEGRALLQALLTAQKAPPKEKAQALSRLNAWMATVPSTLDDRDESTRSDP